MAQDVIPGGVILAAQELKNKVEAQERKYRNTIPFVADLAAGAVGAPAQLTQKIRMTTEGDFLCTHITCKLLGINGAGLPIPDPTTFGATGITMRIFESGWGRELFRDFTAAETFATPGYGTIMYQPFPWEQILLASSDITFDIRNSATVAQRVLFDFHGWQYRGSYKDLRGV